MKTFEKGLSKNFRKVLSNEGYAKHTPTLRKPKFRFIRVICVRFKLNWLTIKNHWFFGKRYISSQSNSLIDDQLISLRESMKVKTTTAERILVKGTTALIKRLGYANAAQLFNY